MFTATRARINVTLFLLVALTRAKALECEVPGSCIGTLIEEEPSNSYDDCLTKCYNDASCYWFTYSPSFDSCTRFRDCPYISEEQCPECLSGERSCDPQEDDNLCNVPSACDDPILLVSTTAISGDDCLIKCQEKSPACQFYQFDYENEVCLLLGSCPDVQGCDSCVHGSAVCTPTYIGNLMIIDDDGAAEVVDLDTTNTVQLPCLIPPSTNIGREGGVSTYSNGRTFVCGGFLDVVCEYLYPFNGAPSSWYFGASLDTIRDRAFGIMLDERNWWITGGYNSTTVLDTTILYDTVTDQITEYVPLPQPMVGHAIVKINENTFFFFGANFDDDVSRPYIFDKSANYFEALPYSYQYSMFDPYIGLVKKSNGEASIVIHDETEPLCLIYDIQTGNWRNDGPTLPSIGYGTSVQYGNTFLVLSDNSHEIYRFAPDTETWELTNRVMQGDYEEPVATLIPPDFVFCG